MTYQRRITTLAILAATAATAAVAHNGDDHGGGSGGGQQEPKGGAKIRYGDALSIGKGRYHAYVRTGSNGEVTSLGVKFHRATLRDLPMKPVTDAKTCFDLNNDNEVDLHDECVGGHSRTLYFGPNPTPFKSITINWEPHGHVPADVYDRPHFDFHFYMISDIERNQIIPGACPGLVNCAVAAKAALPIPAKHVHPDFFNTNLVYAHMGNHYADKTSPEFNGKTFSHTFILGSFAGKVTFFEPMVALDYLQSEPNQCTPIKQPQAYAAAGYYPTKYCIRYDKHSKFYDVSLAGFQYRSAG
jgi:hypothetical protein